MPFKKLEEIREGTRIYVFGETGSGKTPFLLSFPNTALVDPDLSSVHYDKKNVLVKTDAVAIKDIIKDLEDYEAFNPDEFSKILNIGLDSMTRIYENLQHASLKVAEQRARANGRMVDGEGLASRDWGIIKLNHDKLISKLTYYAKLGINIIVIAEGKDKTENVKKDDGTYVMVKTGTTFNDTKAVEFDYDIVLEFFKDGKGSNYAIVHKDRTLSFNPNDRIEMANYSHFQVAIERAQQGRQRTKEEIVHDLNKDIDKEVELINESENEIKKINEMIVKIKALANEKVKKDKVPVAKVLEITGERELNYSTIEAAEAIYKKLLELK